MRTAAADTLIIADGFSCREQIAQLTDRRALHLAQVMHMALHQQDTEGPSEAYARSRFLERADHRQPRPALGAAALVGAGMLAGGLLLWGLSKAEARH